MRQEDDLSTFVKKNVQLVRSVQPLFSLRFSSAFTGRGSAQSTESLAGLIIEEHRLSSCSCYFYYGLGFVRGRSSVLKRASLLSRTVRPRAADRAVGRGFRLSAPITRVPAIPTSTPAARTLSACFGVRIGLLPSCSSAGREGKRSGFVGGPYKSVAIAAPTS